MLHGLDFFLKGCFNQHTSKGCMFHLVNKLEDRNLPTARSLHFLFHQRPSWPSPRLPRLVCLFSLDQMPPAHKTSKIPLLNYQGTRFNFVNKILNLSFFFFFLIPCWSLVGSFWVGQKILVLQQQLLRVAFCLPLHQPLYLHLLLLHPFCHRRAPPCQHTPLSITPWEKHDLKTYNWSLKVRRCFIPQHYQFIPCPVSAYPDLLGKGSQPSLLLLSLPSPELQMQRRALPGPSHSLAESEKKKEKSRYSLKLWLESK